MGIRNRFSSTIHGETLSLAVNPMVPMSNLIRMLALLGLATATVACAESEPPAETATPIAPQSGNLLSSSNAPPPADEVFFPDAFAEIDNLTFRIQTLPGYYLYKDKITVRVLTEGATLGDLSLAETTEVVEDNWFGEQEVYFLEAPGEAPLDTQPGKPDSIDVEISYQGCKKDELCYMPVSKVLTVDLPAVESDRN